MQKSFVRNITDNNQLVVPAKSSQSNADKYSHSVTPTAKDLELDLLNLNCDLQNEFHSQIDSGRKLTKASSESDSMIFSNCLNVCTQTESVDDFQKQIKKLLED